MILVILAILAFETRYIDASGADCVAFGLGPNEYDACHGRFDRDRSPMPKHPQGNDGQ